MNSSIPTTISPFRTLAIFVTLSAGTSIAVYYPVAQWMSATHTDLRFGIVPFAIVVISLHIWLFYGVANALTKIYIALVRMRHNLPVSEIPLTCSYILRPTIEQVNGFITERTDLRTMRGVLVEQISEAAAQEERNRLARDLHDSIKQQVFSMSISAAAAHAHLESNPPAARAALNDVKQSAQEAMVEMRALLQQLSPAPLEKSGLIQALRDQCEALAYRTGATVTPTFSPTLPPDDRLPTGSQEAIFRIAQETLSNIARHARAQHVTLSLEYVTDQDLTLRIADDGQGFDVTTNPAGMGLGNIRSRASTIGATISLTSAVGAGTTLSLTIPLLSPINTSEDEAMYAQYENDLKPVINQYFRFAGGISVFIFSISLLAWRLIYRQDTLMEDPISVVLLFIIGALSVFALPFAVLSLRTAHRTLSPLITRSGIGGRIDLKLRRHIHMAYLTISAIGAWFIPMPWINETPNNWMPVFISSIFFASMVWNYLQMGRLYRAEVELMRDEKRVPELNQRLNELRSAWPSLFFLLLVTVISGALSGEIRFPPIETDHWMNTAFIVISVLLVINQIVSIVTYRRWKREFGL